MQGTPERTVILHWDEGQCEWARIAWPDWVRFRGMGGVAGNSLLPGATAGEHFFLVCILGNREELWNIIPHRYVVSEGARLVGGFDGLSESEREESCRIEDLAFPTVDEVRRYEELGDRGFSVNLPPPHTINHFLKAMPRIVAAEYDSACWKFLSAIGICQASRRIH
jgi:hypothetical protein